jgi:hypothetical protein
MPFTCKRAGRKKGKVKFPGLCADAASLFVTPSHLWLVLVSRRSSKSLLRRYRVLKKNQRTAARDERALARSGHDLAMLRKARAKMRDGIAAIDATLSQNSQQIQPKRMPLSI